MLLTLAATLLSAALVDAAAIVAVDPCIAATSGSYVSASVAHACELAIPFDKARSQFVIDNTILATPFYTLENWFLNSPNPLIPHHVDLNNTLLGIQKKVASTGYSTDWDFNIAVTNAFNVEWDGHTVWAAACTEAFSWNHPFSVASWASDPKNPISFPQPGLEAYYQSLGLNLRQYDGFQIVTIDGIEANIYLLGLATASSVYTGLIGAYESVEPRYMRLMSRYSADTVSGAYTQEVGRFAARPFYPGTNSIKFVLAGNGSLFTVTVPWTANFIGSGTDTASFIAETCLTLPVTEGTAGKASKNDVTQKKAVVGPDAGWSAWSAQTAVSEQKSVPGYLATSGSGAGQSVTPNLTSFGVKVDTIDIYQLQKHPKVGVVYIQQFEPSDGTTYQDYFVGVSKALYTGLTELKAAGVKHILIDQSGNRGGYIYAGAIAIWSLFSQDLYPGFPAVLRELDLARRLSDAAAATENQNSEYFYGFYRDLSYRLLTSNAQFMEPPVPQVVNGVKDAYSKQFFDDFGDSSAAVTNFTAPPFAGSDIVLVANSICASTCSVFSSYLYQKHQVRSAVFGSYTGALGGQFDGGVKGSEVSNYDEILYELEINGLANDTAAPQTMPIELSFTFNFRNAIPYIDLQDGILEYVYEPATKKYSFTRQTYNNPQTVWEFVAEEFFGSN